MTGTRYSEKEIERIIERGSVKQKARLAIRDRMGYNGTGFILTYSQVEELNLSVRTAIDREQWEDLMSRGGRIENGFKDLTNLLRSLMRDRDFLLMSIRTIRDFELLEESLNKLIDPKEELFFDGTPEADMFLTEVGKVNIRERRLPERGFSLIKPKLDSSNHIDFHLTGENSLTERTKELRDNLRETMRLYLCLEYAIKQRISELPLDIPEYEEALSKNREILEQPVSISLRFEGVQDNRTFQLGECNLKDRDPQEYPFPSLRDLIEDYSVRPQDIDLSTKENQATIKEMLKQV